MPRSTSTSPVALRLLACLLLALAGVAGGASPASAKAKGKVTRCKRGQLAVPPHMRKKAFTLGLSVKGKAKCITPGQGNDRASKLAPDMHRVAAKQVKKLDSRKVKRLTAAVNRVVAAPPRAARASRAASAHAASSQTRDFSGKQDGVVFEGHETTSGIDVDSVGDGSDTTVTRGSKRDGKAMVTVETKRSRTSRSPGCPTAAGLIEGILEIVTDKTTTTVIGEQRVTEHESRTVTTTFTAHVGDDAALASVDIERHEHGETSTRTEIADVGFKDVATYGVDVTVPGGGQPTGRGVRTLHADKGTQRISDDLDQDIVNAAGRDSQSDVGTLIDKARQMWQTPNRCAAAVYKGDGQTVKRGGVVSVSADMYTKRTPDIGGQGGDRFLHGTFTATGACGATPDPGSDTSGGGKSAHFFVNDTSRVWGTRAQPKGCLQLRGVSRGGVTSGNLTFPVITTFVLTYNGNSTYSYSSDFSFMSVTSTDEQNDTYGWMTTYNPVTLAPGQTVAGDTGGTDALTGSARTHTTDNSSSPATDTACNSDGVPSDREGNRPRLTITNPTQSGFDMELRESGVARWDASCDDGSQRGIYPTADNDPSPNLDFTSQIHVDYAQLENGPLALQVGSTPEQAHHDCSSDNVTCTSSLHWSGTITIDNGQ